MTLKYVRVGGRTAGVLVRSVAQGGRQGGVTGWDWEGRSSYGELTLVQGNKNAREVWYIHI